MKKTWMMLVALCFLTLAVALAKAGNEKKGDPKTADSKAAPTQVHNWKLPAGFSADEAYKSNCTRCHAEVPQMGTRRTRTVINHMRVRADLTKDEAEAIFEYLNK